MARSALILLLLLAVCCQSLLGSPGDLVLSILDRDGKPSMEELMQAVRLLAERQITLEQKVCILFVWLHSSNLHRHMYAGGRS